MSRATLVIVLALLHAVSVDAGVSPAVRCEGAKLAAAGRRVRVMLGCHQLAAHDGTTVAPDCLAAAATRFTRSIARAEENGGCVTTGDGPAIAARADAFLAGVVTTAAGEAPTGCQVPVLGATGRAARRLVSGYAGLKRSGGNAARLASGQRRAVTGLADELARAHCASSPAAALADAARDLVSDLVVPLWCGDGVRDPAEVCDGGDDRACPGACGGDCRCGPMASACLAGTGPRLTLSGTYADAYEDRALAPGSRLDARAATLLGMASSPYPLNLGGGSDACVAGGTVAGQYDRGLTWNEMHDLNNAAVRFEGDRFLVDGLRADDVGDGLRPVGRDFVVRGAWLSYVRDDCIENDHLQAGLIEDVLFDGCYVGVSERPSPAILESGYDGRRSVLTIHGSLIRLESMPGPAEGDAPTGHGQFFKWDDRATTLALHDDVFLAGETGVGGPETMAMTDRLVSCANNVMVWLGPGDYPAPLPSCFTVTRDRGVWDAAVAAWHARH